MKISEANLPCSDEANECIWQLNLVRNAIEWSGSSYLHAKTELLSLLAKAVLFNTSIEISIYCDLTTYYRFYERWIEDEGLNVTNQLSFHLVSIDESTDNGCLDEVEFYETATSQTKCRKLAYLSRWYDAVETILESHWYDLEHFEYLQGEPLKSLEQYQRTQFDLIVAKIPLSK